MHVYLVTIISSLMLFFLCSPRRKRKDIAVRSHLKKRLTIRRTAIGVALAAFPPMIVAAVRYKVGTDYVATYYTGFYRILNGSTVDGFEFGYYWFNRLIQVFTDNVFVLFAITAVIFVAVSFAAIYEESYNVPLSILLFFVTRYYFVGMNIVRQFIAAAILVYSIRYVLHHDLKKYIVCIILAFSMHYTSIIFLPVYFLPRLRISVKRLITIIIGELAFFSFGVGWFISFLQDTKYGSLIARHDVCGIKFTIFTVAVNIVILLVGYCGYKERKNDERYRLYLNIQVMAVLITLVFRAIPLMERVYWYFSFPCIITIPYLFLSVKKKSYRLLVTAIVIAVFITYMFYDIVILGDHDALPYQWIFGKSPVHYSGWQ